MKFKWRKWNRIIHRDLGYIFFAMTVIYAMSGIAINHVNDWNANYIVNTKQIQLDEPLVKAEITKNLVLKILKDYDVDGYKKHYFPNDNILKVFIKNGVVRIDMRSGRGLIEKTRRRPILGPMNYLHYNPVIYWTIFSDAFAVALILIAVSGLFILKGKKGITRRGAWLTGLGILIPIIYLLIYFY